jgi:hypothetical protein
MSVKKGKPTIVSPTPSVRELRECEQPVIDEAVKANEVLSVQSVADAPTEGLGRPLRRRGNLAEEIQVSTKQAEVEDDEDEYPDEKGRASYSTDPNELGSPPPYSQRRTMSSDKDSVAT